MLYNVSIYNIVTAYDGKTGHKLWTYNPKVANIWARWACCGPSARGIAAWKGKIYIGALDGRLIAVDAKTGREVWVTQTFEPNKDPYSITGAPRVYDGKVVIGNGGGDYGSRGFVSAYDAETGKKLWKFFIVPTDPSRGPDGEASDSAMKIAAPHLVRQVLGSRRWRQCVGQLRLRSQAQHRLYRHRQRRAAHVALPQRRQRRQSVPLLDGRGRCDHRQV